MSSSIKKFDFDQYPDNAASSVDEGLIIKLSIDDARVAGTAWEGLNMNYLMFFPRFLGVCSYCIVLMRLRVKQIINWDFNVAPAPWDYNFDIGPISKEIFFDNFYVGAGKTRIFSFVLPKVFINQTGSQEKMTTAPSITFKDVNGVNQMSYSPGRLSQIKQVYPCVYYNYYFPTATNSPFLFFNKAGMPLMDIPSIASNVPYITHYESCVAQPADLSTRMKQIFPDSWVTP